MQSVLFWGKTIYGNEPRGVRMCTQNPLSGTFISVVKSVRKQGLIDPKARVPV